MATQTSHWSLLPDLCLRRACTYSHDIVTLHELRLVCSNFYIALPIPEELLQDHTALDYSPHTLLPVFVKSDISVASLTWFVRLAGIVKEDVTRLNYTSSVVTLRFLFNLYGQTPKFLESSDVGDPPAVARSLEAMQFLLGELQLNVDNIRYWFASACKGGDIACMEYTKDKLSFTRDDINFPVVPFLFSSRSIDAVSWFMQTFGLSSQILTDQGAFLCACGTNDLEFIREIYKRHDITLASSDYDFYNLPYISLGYAIRSSNVALLKFVEELYGESIPGREHHHDFLWSIYDESKGTPEEQRIMLDYICDRYNINPREGRVLRFTSYLNLTCDFKVLREIQSKFHLTAEEARGLKLLQLAKTESQLRVLKDIFCLTAEDARADNCEVLRKACIQHNADVIHGLHTVFGLSKEDAERCHAVEATMAHSACFCRSEVLQILRDEYRCET